MQETSLTEIILHEDAPDDLMQTLIGFSVSKWGQAAQKHFVEFGFRNLVCEVLDNHQTQVYKKSFISQRQNIVEYSKEKQAYHVFPSTNQLHSTCHVSKLTFKLPSCMQLHFERRNYGANHHNKVYIATTKGVGTTANEIIQCLSAVQAPQGSSDPQNDRLACKAMTPDR